jgi:2,4-dienoyl-CoA reductase-like NADH-dependent reductase (Old Yellow Enzyme family)
MTGAVGIITNAAQAEEILQNMHADLIFMAREQLRDPYFALHAAKALGDDIEWPVQYLRAKR